MVASFILAILLGLFGLLLLVALITAIWGIGVYNRFVQLRNRFQNAFSQIDVQLKRRYDLIPNLVEIAKGYIKHERETLEAVIAARNQAASASQRVGGNPSDTPAMQGLVTAEAGLTGALGRLFAVVEAYPDLKANQNMMQLSEELTSTENKIAFARQAYNDAVMTYNTAIEIFPAGLIARMFNFGRALLFEVSDPGQREAPKVQFT
ncbi:MAG: LemA family protein [Verrucomicrobiia bacterium]